MRKNRIRIMTALLAGILLTFPAVPVQAAEDSAADVTEMLGEVKDKLKEAVSGMDEETVQEVFDFLQEKAADGSLTTQNGMQEAISEGEDKFGFTVDEEDAKKVVAAMEKLEDMGFSGEYVIDKSAQLYEQYGADFVEHTDEVITGAVQDAVTNAARGFFANLWDSAKKFVKNLFSQL